MYKTLNNYVNCNDCLSYKYSAASLLQPYKKPELNAYSIGTPTYKAMSLKDATNDFLNNYIRNASKFYNTTKISNLRKDLNVTREGLTKIIKNNNITLEDISNTLTNNKNYFITNYSLDEIKDPMQRYFVENATKKGFNLKKDIGLFKRTYANNMARTFGFYNATKNIGFYEAIKLDPKEIIKYGINEAAQTLGITKRRMQDLVKDYYTTVKLPLEKILNEQKEQPKIIDFSIHKKTQLEKHKIKEMKEKERIDKLKQELKVA
jgi:plasmid maintenance system antidote protein VapI